MDIWLVFSITFGLVIGIIVVAVLPYIAKQRRKKCLSSRPINSVEKWHEEFFAGQGLDQELVRRVCEALGKEIGVDATQIYPSDRFDRELACPEWWGDRGHELEDFEAWVVEFLCAHNRKLPKKYCWKAATVGEFIKELGDILS